MGTKRRTPAGARIGGPRKGDPDRVTAAKNELENETGISRGSAEKFQQPNFGRERGARKRVQWPNWPRATGPGPNKEEGRPMVTKLFACAVAGALLFPQAAFAKDGSTAT